jgi:cellobiose phosphorylase
VTSAIVGDLISLKLEAGACARVDLVFRVESSVDSAESALRASMDAQQIDSEILRIEQEDAEQQEGIGWHVSGGGDRFKPEAFNIFTRHLKKQVEFCSLIKGYVQLAANSLIGIRDVFQALEALSFWQPEVARGKMLEALDYTAPSGRCFRQYSCPSASGEMGRMDLRPFIDQGAWVVSTVATYLKVSGDWNFLTVECGYHKIINEHLGKVERSEEYGSVLEHLIRIFDFLLHNRDPETRCVLALYGDWNDSLDGLGISREGTGEYGTGVSVMATLQVYQNLNEMVEILGRVDAEKFAGKIDSYTRAMREIVRGLEQYAVVSASAGGSGGSKILHGWGDRRGYFVGSFDDPDGRSRDSLTSNAFWVLSGLWRRTVDPNERKAMKEAILGAFDRLDSKYGLKTFHPAFDPDTEGVGRIGKLPPGTAENGAAYVHATLFGIQALFMLGEPKRAWEQIYKVLPFTELHCNLSHSPFVMPNSYGYNPEKFIDGQSMNDWQTGSSNVLMKVLVRNVFGFEPGFREVWLQPASYFPFDRFRFKIDFRGCEFTVEYENRGLGKRCFEWDGKRVDGVPDPVLGIPGLPIPYENLGRKILVRVID